MQEWFSRAVSTKGFSNQGICVDGEWYNRKDCFDKVIELDDPATARYWYCLGFNGGSALTKEQGSRAQSVKQCYVNSLEIDRKYSIAWNGLGLVGGGEVKGVLHNQTRCFVKAVETANTNTIAWVNLGIMGGGENYY